MPSCWGRIGIMARQFRIEYPGRTWAAGRVLAPSFRLGQDQMNADECAKLRFDPFDNHYENYVIFKPDPQGSSISITLQKVSWAWAASAQLRTYSMTWDICNPPALITGGPSDSDEFPVWKRT